MATLRPATVCDIPSMSQIRLSVRENALADPARITTQMYEDYLALRGRGWVAELEGKVVGFCYADAADASIWALFIAPAYEGRGIARALLGKAVAWLFGQGHAAVRLSTGMGTRAERFYLAQGWVREAADGKDAHFVLARAQETPLA